MQNPALFHVLMDHLDATGATRMDIERFLDRWHRLRPHEAFPSADSAPSARQIRTRKMSSMPDAVRYPDRRIRHTSSTHRSSIAFQSFLGLPNHYKDNNWLFRG
jgi:hypothetical protein